MGCSDGIVLYKWIKQTATEGNFSINCRYIKAYLETVVISVYLINEWRNQRPQQQRYSAGFAKHVWFFNSQVRKRSPMFLASRGGVASAECRVRNQNK